MVLLSVLNLYSHKIPESSFLNPDQHYQDTQIWDVGTVLRHLKTIPTTKNAPSKDLKIPNGYVNVFSFGPTWSKYTYA